ncbi:hypothetical protein [Mesonia maritima]|uniref:CHASE3 domain sensor protein n=1 Tax=Mesonia maritima TaxID=1793873 RepID=A0ABU1K2F0_9FLAO|nr:hypothetical protein [Mesonia maritima]MDR6299782.1 CHASE3 domain sensor protein [Mesonia maritima]
MFKPRKLQFLFILIFLLGVVTVIYIINFSLNHSFDDEIKRQTAISLVKLSELA